MSQRLVPFLLLFSHLVAGAAGAETGAGLAVEALEATHENGTVYRFPRIVGETPAAKRINTYLRVVYLETPPVGEDAAAFEAIWPKDSANGVTSLDYTTSLDVPGILSVSIAGWSYGAYESPIGGEHFFDWRTGEPITLRSLFSAEGLAKLDAEITQRRLRRVDDFLAGKVVDEDTRLRSDPEEAEEQKALYRECRSFIEQGTPTGDSLSLQSDGLRLVREPCAPRVLRALDELGFADSRSYASIAPLLNDYGRCLLVARQTSCPRTHTGVHPGVYRGKLGGRYPITLVIQQADPRYVQASYYYDEHAKLIRLRSGKVVDGVLQLDEAGSPPARFELRAQTDGRLVGEWTQQGKAPLPVELR